MTYRVLTDDELQAEVTGIDGSRSYSEITAYCLNQLEAQGYKLLSVTQLEGTHTFYLHSDAPATRNSRMW